MTTPAQPPAKGAKKKGAFANPMTWVIVLGVALLGGAYLLYRQHQNAAAAAGTTAATPSSEDFAGEIATLQAEIADLQSSGAQEATGTGTTTGGTTAPLTAPGGLSITPHPGFADFGWSTVPNAKAYELQVTGAGGKGSGASHFDHAGTGNHAEHVSLAPGKYRARVRAGTSLTSLSGPWSAWKDFTMGGILHGTPIKGKNPVGVKTTTGGGESENDSGSG